MLKYTAIMVLVILVLTGCGLQMERYQGQTSRDDVENMGMNDKVTVDTQNPRSIKNVGNTWGLKQDRQMIKDAVAQMEGVEVRRVILEASQVWVSVDVDNEEDMSKEEKEQMQEKIKQTIFKAVPRYNIHVKIK
ncbi:hypothetical protein H0267_10160 [Halobacillus sp. KCTC 3957]|uniref:Sporulation lipoprotein YhcN/YlaJ-like protein n=2 Tax=Halobacillus yeomjeoni TaxID=311194 RepID=A0A931HWN9_9BACI|nr:hypothetical protein [Halobacillus yeomjeoni]